MARYCGQCGSVLGVTALQEGRCGNCGADIEPSEETYDKRAIALSEDPTQEVFLPSPLPSPENMLELPGIVDGAYGGDHTASTGKPYVWLPRQPVHQGASALFWTLALLSAAAILVAVIGLAVLTQRGTLSTIISPFTSSSPTGSSGLPLTGATATAPASSGQGTQSGATPTSGGGGVPTASVIATGSPTIAPTTTPLPPALSVSPTSISIRICTAVSTTITIANTGGMPLEWSASSPIGGYTFLPSSGTIDPGLQQTVSVRVILRSGVVKVTSANGTNSPQQVVIKCGV